MRKSIFAFAALSVSLLAQTQKFEYWPGSVYDPAIPTARSVLGHDLGDRILSSANLVKYMEALAAAAPRRMKVFDYGRSWEGRRLVYAAIGSEANVRRLPEIKAAMQKLYDPRKTAAAEAQKLMANLPAVVWLGYGVHGNEISSPEAALQTAYHLLASRNDELVTNVLANVLVLIDPIQNPDGRDRFVTNYETSEGLEPDSNPLGAEHNEPWPGGRTNHYYFDLNRDWLAITQPETAGRVKALREWYPLVFVDLHEMGTESTYYFAPEAVPYNPHLTKEQKEPLYWFGKNNAKYFDQFGFSYFTREVYDAFYPGYGASWPAYYGALAMTYENGSTRGLIVQRNSDDTTITFRQTVRRHFVSSVSTCETAAVNRAKLLENFYQYHVTAVDEGNKEPVREYIIPRRGNVSAADRLASLMVQHGAEVQRATAAFKNGNAEYPAGSYVIPLAQPAKRMIRTFLDPQVLMDDSFLKDEERRRKRRLGSEIYDVTAWSLPLQIGAEAVGAPARSQGSFEPFQPAVASAGHVVGTKATVAYLVPWGPTSAARFLASALREGVRVYSSDKKFVLGGRTYGAGTLIVKVKENPESVHETVQKIAKSSGAEVIATETGWVDEGPNFGSRYVFYLKKPSVAIAWDRPISGGSAGQLRFVIERQFGYPVSVVRTQQLATADLSKFNVIILPEGGFGEGYSAALGPNGARRLKDWVQTGGTLVGIGSALQFLASPAAALLSITQENAAPPSPPSAAAGSAGEGQSRRPDGAASPSTTAAAPPPSAGPAATAIARTPGKLFAKDEDLDKAIQPDTDLPGSAHGFLARAKVDQEHWTTVGVPETVYAMVSGRSIFSPVKADRGVNTAVFAGPDQVVASGYIWDEFRKQVAYKPLTVVQRDGRGWVIGFTEDPSFRAYMDGLNVLLANAVFRGPGHSSASQQFGEE
jgi:hypothetical protein